MSGRMADAGAVGRAGRVHPDSAAGTTAYARTTLTGLPALVTVGFRVCVTIGNGEPGPWTQVVSILVH